MSVFLFWWLYMGPIPEGAPVDIQGPDAEMQRGLLTTPHDYCRAPWNFRHCYRPWTDA